MWGYDKKTYKEVEASIRNIASENKFYELNGKNLKKRAGEEWKKIVSEAQKQKIRKKIPKNCIVKF